MPETSVDENHVGDDALRDIVLDWRALKSKRQKRRKFKDYQEQLLKVFVSNKFDLAKIKFMITTNKFSHLSKFNVSYIEESSKNILLQKIWALKNLKI